MSWDFDLMIDAGGHEPFSVADANYTYNVYGMFRLAFSWTSDCGIRCLNGMRCEVAKAVIDVAISKMESEPNVYRAMNPPNGWGNYEGALGLLRTLRDWCVRAPKGSIRVS